MSYRRSVLVGSISLLTFFHFLSSVSADPHLHDKVFIQHAIQKMDTATKSKDADGYVVFTSANFINIDKTGQETTHGKIERREKLVRLFANVTRATSQTTVTQITFTKEGAIIDESQVFSLALARNNQKLQMTGKGSYHDLWVKTGSGWLQQQSRTLTETVTINGKPLP